MTGAEVIAVYGNRFSLVKVRSDGYLAQKIIPAMHVKGRTGPEVLREFLDSFMAVMDPFSAGCQLRETQDRFVYDAETETGSHDFLRLLEEAERSLQATEEKHFQDPFQASDEFPGSSYLCGYGDVQVFIDCDAGTVTLDP